jgi:hypothetical protein
MTSIAAVLAAAARAARCLAVAAIMLPFVGTALAAAPAIDVQKWDPKGDKVQIVNSGTIDFDADWLRNLDRIEVKLPNEKTLVLVRNPSKSAGKDVFMWTGHEVSDPLSVVTFTVSGNVVSGSIILSDGRVFKLETIDGKKYRFDQIDPSKLPAGGAPVPRPPAKGATPGVPVATAPVSPVGVAAAPSPPVLLNAPPPPPPPPPSPAPVAPGDAAGAAGGGAPAAGAGPAAPGALAGRGEPGRGAVPGAPQAGGPAAPMLPAEAPAACVDDGKVIDILVGYTKATTTPTRSAAEIERQICTAEGEANATYRLPLDFQIRIVGIDQIDLPPMTIATAVDELHNQFGVMKPLHLRRDALAADVIVLVVDTNDGSCGLSNLLTDVNDATFESWAFSVIPFDCLTGNFTLAHELGHVMGGQHDIAVDSSAGALKFDHGYVQTNPKPGRGPWLTIMAQYTKCTTEGKTCARLGRWSHPPELLPNGDMLGDETSNETETLARTVSTVANFRCAAKLPAPVPRRCPEN